MRCRIERMSTLLGYSDICGLVMKIQALWAGQYLRREPLVRAQGALFLAIPVAFSLGSAFVVLFFTFRQAYREFRIALAPKQPQGHQGIAFSIDSTDELANFSAIK